MNTRRRRSQAFGLVFVVGLLAAGCSSSDDEQAEEQEKAEQLVSSLQAAGIAPRLTADTAEALYGTDAPAVCDAFSGGVSTSGSLILLGNPAGRRPKTITENAVEYARIVIETYCPDVSADYDDLVEDLDPFESTS